MEAETENPEEKSFIKRKKSSLQQELEENDTECGFGIIRGKWFQKLASKNIFLVVHSLTGMIYSASFYYLSGTLTTLEKQYKFSSAQMGYINAIYDITATIVALIAPYYCSKGRSPRWMGFAILCYAISFVIYIIPYFLYGLSDDILSLTEEFDRNFNLSSSAELVHQMKVKELCYANSKFGKVLKKMFMESFFFL